MKNLLIALLIVPLLSSTSYAQDSNSFLYTGFVGIGIAIEIEGQLFNRNLRNELRQVQPLSEATMTRLIGAEVRFDIIEKGQVKQERYALQTLEDVAEFDELRINKIRHDQAQLRGLKTPRLRWARRASGGLVAIGIGLLVYKGMDENSGLDLGSWSLPTLGGGELQLIEPELAD